MEIQDYYDHTEPLSYILENVLYEPKEEELSGDYQKLKDLYNSILTNSCSCSVGDCSTECGCHHGGNYQSFLKEDGSRELVLKTNRRSKDLIYECFQLCNCSQTCTNRLVQFGPRRDLDIIETYQKGKGLISTEPIPNGAFICEYAGELITKLEALKRNKRNIQQKKPNYIICLNEIPTGADSIAHPLSQTFIDPSEKGNIGRYLNHSCDPNCEILSVRVDGPVPKLGIFSKRKVEAFEELTFHYGIGNDLSDSTERHVCYCGTNNCQKFLPNLQF